MVEVVKEESNDSLEVTNSQIQSLPAKESINFLEVPSPLYPIPSDAPNPKTEISIIKNEEKPLSDGDYVQTISIQNVDESVN
jgi:hypothetical protein